jgi:transcriptional regulator with XRE-family HTH domain
MTPLSLKLWRVARSLSQAQLAKLLGVTQQTISHWELTFPPDDLEARLRAVQAPSHCAARSPLSSP